MSLIGSGATGVQVASIFSAFGSRIQLFEAGPRIVPSEDEELSVATAAAFRESGMVVHENFGIIESFEKTRTGVRMIYSKDGNRDSAEAALAVVAVGWAADTAARSLAATGVEADHQGFIKVDGYLRTSAPHIFAAGDSTGRLMLVPQALQAGFVAAANAVRGLTLPLEDHVSPIGSFTGPEYAPVGLTEAKARATHDVVTAVVHVDSTTRTVLAGRKFGSCKRIADRKTCRTSGCHAVGERAVDILDLQTQARQAHWNVKGLHFTRESPKTQRDQGVPRARTAITSSPSRTMPFPLATINSFPVRPRTSTRAPSS
jgi:pyruvate/2-oxoglutarate dehydrogenase complex dihydrolipoamide dehydrogenase (E3) component